MNKTRITIATLKERKAAKKPITMLTAYDYSTASLLDEAGVDMLLVGDSLGNVILGYDSTLPVTMEDMIHHGRAVCRGAKNAFVVIDMPFMSYQISPEEALKNAGRIMKETGAQAVKLEGGIEILEGIRRMLAAGIPVVGHLGLTPQSVNQLGGFKVQGKDLQTAEKLLSDAMALSDAGAAAIVLECVPSRLAAKITEMVRVPTIGIGAGAGCDGQVLVIHDLLGFNDGFHPKFVKCFSHLHDEILQAVHAYQQEVTARIYPCEGKHTFKLSEEVAARLDTLEQKETKREHP